VNHVWATQGLSKTFIFDRDTRFTSAFWRKVILLLGTRLSSTFHAPTDGQTKNVNQVLETYMRHLIAPTMIEWDKWLSRPITTFITSLSEPRPSDWSLVVTLVLPWVLRAMDNALHRPPLLLRNCDFILTAHGHFCMQLNRDRKQSRTVSVST
jgi:hypothetical protein